MSNIHLCGIEFHKVEQSSIIIGSNKGGWIYAGQRPAHEVRCPEFYIMMAPLTRANVAALLGGPDTDEAPEEMMESLDGNAVREILESASKQLAKTDLSGYEIRCPTESEWRIAKQNCDILLPAKKVEILADAASQNYRGAMMDGRPRPIAEIGVASRFRAAMESHPHSEGVYALSTVPIDRPLRDVVARFVITPIREGEPKQVPENADFKANLAQELFWTTILGVVPSFTIPVLRGMASYVTEGWANLLFGGLCAGFVTGAFWRPKRPVLKWEDVE